MCAVSVAKNVKLKINRMKPIKAFALIDKKKTGIYQLDMHVLKADNPFCIYPNDTCLETIKNSKMVPVEIIIKDK